MDRNIGRLIVRQDLEPLEFEGGFHFQFVNVPPPPSIIDQLHIRESPSYNFPNLQTEVKVKEPNGLETIFIESEGSDDEGIKKNVIIKKLGLVQYKSKASERSNSSSVNIIRLPDTNTEIYGKVKLSEDSDKLTSVIVKNKPNLKSMSTNQVPPPTKSSENIKNLVDKFFPAIRRTQKKRPMNKMVVDQLPKPQSVIKDTKSQITNKASVSASHQVKSVIHKPSSSISASSSVLKIESSGSFSMQQNQPNNSSRALNRQENDFGKGEGKGVHQVISSGPVILNSPAGTVNLQQNYVGKGAHQVMSSSPVIENSPAGTLNLQHNYVGKGAHQIISSSPMIVNSLDAISKNAPIRHYIIPKNSSTNADNLRPHILKHSTTPVLKVVKMVSPVVYTNINHSSDLSPLKQPANSLRLKTLSSLTNTPATSSVQSKEANKIFGQESVCNLTQTIEYPAFVQVHQSSDINNTNGGEEQMISAQYQQLSNDSFQLQPFSLGFQNLLDQNLIELHRVAASTANIHSICMPQSVKNINSSSIFKPDTVKNINQKMGIPAAAVQSQKNYQQKGQNKSYTYLELNKVNLGKKPTNQENNEKKSSNKIKEKGSNLLLMNELQLCSEVSRGVTPFKYKNKFSCFTTGEWMESNRGHQVLEFGFSQTQCLDKKCKSTLTSIICKLENKLVDQFEKLQELEKAQQFQRSKKKYFKKGVSYPHNPLLSDTCPSSLETKLAVKSDFPAPSTSSNDLIGIESDNDLLVTSKVVILNNGAEEEQENIIERKKNKRRAIFMPKKGYCKKKYDCESIPVKERPIDYRIYSKISAMKKLHNIRPCYVEIENNQLVKKALALYKKNKKCFLKLTPSELKILKEKDKFKEARQVHIFTNWFNNKVITNLSKFKTSIASEKPMLFINKDNMNELLRHYKQFNIIFPAIKLLPENLPRNKGFTQLVGLGHVKIVDTRVLSEYFREL